MSTGKERATDVECWTCGGTGKILRGLGPGIVDCPRCHGSGRLAAPLALEVVADAHHRTTANSKLHDPANITSFRDCHCRTCGAATAALDALDGELRSRRMCLVGAKQTLTTVTMTLENATDLEAARAYLSKQIAERQALLDEAVAQTDAALTRPADSSGSVSEAGTE